ncbi:hypothetical protein [uncultured Rikenella sp.]|uniref:hypothetical protein n=1 Tax=uncultured Rikenella sp. TaxID=368003 RepID=UPI002604C755|nr:hypothetical protein [uncultured Rikenella sp.]
MLKDKFNNYPKTTKYYSKNNSSHHNPPKTVTNETIHLSAPGYRYVNSGDLVGSGSYGSVRSASVNGINSVYLDISASLLRPNFTHYRAHGFQLRCLSE